MGSDASVTTVLTVTHGGTTSLVQQVDGLWRVQSGGGTTPCGSLFDALDTALGTTRAYRCVSIHRDVWTTFAGDELDELRERIDEAVLGWAAMHRTDLPLERDEDSVVAVWVSGEATFVPRQLVDARSVDELEECEDVRNVQTTSAHWDVDDAPTSGSYWEHVFAYRDLYYFVKQSSGDTTITCLGRFTSTATALAEAEEQSSMHVYRD